MSEKKINRRRFIKGAAAAGAGVALGALAQTKWSLAELASSDSGAVDRAIRDQKQGALGSLDAQATVEAYMNEGMGRSRVVHVHSEEATSWNGETDYWNYVDQDAVYEMVDQGIMSLTGTSTVADAWQSLIPTYQQGQGIAIKVNFNNSSQCNDADGQIDALIQPVNAVVRGLKQIGVVETDIWVYDAVRPIPNRFADGGQYGGVRFFDSGCRDNAGWGSGDPDAYVDFSPPPGIPVPPETKITDVLINATYLINMPIMKRHGLTGVSLGFKNHLGTIDRPQGQHDYISIGWTYFRPDYNPLVDIYLYPHITAKTILIISDGLFASRERESSSPSVWATFGNQVPNSLFLATDPVSVDCVMCDFLDAENGVTSDAEVYLRLASDAGLGVFERGVPWGSGYSQIDYLKIEL